MKYGGSNSILPEPLVEIWSSGTMTPLLVELDCRYGWNRHPMTHNIHNSHLLIMFNIFYQTLR